MPVKYSLFPFCCCELGQGGLSSGILQHICIPHYIRKDKLSYFRESENYAVLCGEILDLLNLQLLQNAVTGFVFHQRVASKQTYKVVVNDESGRPTPSE
jgi:hypothetical protein